VLSELTAAAGRLALVGLAKNTGKTEALAALLRELEAGGRHVGVTSVGRDGEERDVINPDIRKPQVLLPGGSIVATTDALLRASALPHDLLQSTGLRTPLGQVLIARLRGRGALEVAGPSDSAGLRAVSEAMLGYGAEQVLIDGAIDRRAASSPAVADGLVMSTGAVLSQDIEEVVAITRDAVELVRLGSVAASAPALGELLAGEEPKTVLLSEDLEAVALAPRFVLTSDAEQIARLLAANPGARWLAVAGALPEHFLQALLQAMRRRDRELTVVVADPTKVFLSARSVSWYRAQGVELQVLNPIELKAITVNPVAPQSHRFDSAQLRALLREAIDGVAIFDVLHSDYEGVGPALSSTPR
jgi:hypothetical protein